MLFLHIKIDFNTNTIIITLILIDNERFKIFAESSVCIETVRLIPLEQTILINVLTTKFELL